MKLKVLIGIVILVPVLAHLVYAGLYSTFTSYYVTVDELLARSKTAPRQQVRLGGPVVAGSIRWETSSSTLYFSVGGNGTTLPVVYRGSAPDTFRDGAVVILEGEKSGEGFVANSLMVRCPHEFVSGL